MCICIDNMRMDSKWNWCRISILLKVRIHIKKFLIQLWMWLRIHVVKNSFCNAVKVNVHNFSNLERKMWDILATNQTMKQYSLQDMKMIVSKRWWWVLSTKNSIISTLCKLRCSLREDERSSVHKLMFLQLLLNCIFIVLPWGNIWNLLGKIWVRFNTTILSLGVSMCLDYVILWNIGYRMCLKLLRFSWEDWGPTLKYHFSVGNLLNISKSWMLISSRLEQDSGGNRENLFLSIYRTTR